MTPPEGRASARLGEQHSETDKRRSTSVGDLDGLRIGCVKYLNARPLTHGWLGPVEYDHPANLCRRLRAAQLDIAFVSSFEWLTDPTYNIVDGVAVGADGTVYSVFLAHGGAVEDVEEVELDPASSTSMNLLRCLLGEHGFTPKLITPAPGTEQSVTKTRARLFIGDQAIRFRQEHSANLEFCDLGSWWKVTTGLPFVFALWLIRPEVAHAKEIANRLRELRDRNLCYLHEVIAEEKEFTSEFCERYFRENLRFGFAAREKEGLLKFRSLCEKHGIVQGNAPELRLV